MDKHETALKCAEQLIRRNPPDLAHRAPELSRDLLYLENSFDLEVRVRLAKSACCADGGGQALLLLLLLMVVVVVVVVENDHVTPVADLVNPMTLLRRSAGSCATQAEVLLDTPLKFRYNPRSSEPPSSHLPPGPPHARPAPTPVRSPRLVPSTKRHVNVTLPRAMWCWC